MKNTSLVIVLYLLLTNANKTVHKIILTTIAQTKAGAPIIKEVRLNIEQAIVTMTVRIRLSEGKRLAGGIGTYIFILCRNLL